MNPDFNNQTSNDEPVNMKEPTILNGSNNATEPIVLANSINNSEPVNMPEPQSAPTNIGDSIPPQKITDEPKKKNNKILILCIIIAFLIIGICLYFFLFNKKDLSDNKPNEKETEIVPFNSEYKITSNSLEAFDLYFLQLENSTKNKVYSPLSIKYALAMLNEGTKGNSKAQILGLIGDYQAKKYTNDANMSLANALFIKDTYKSAMESNYVSTLSNKYNAEVIYDSFTNPNNLNSWVSNKTFNLINNLFDKVDDQDFILVNALAIDMEWINKIQSEHEDYTVSYDHEKFAYGIGSLDSSDYSSIKFNNKVNAKSAQIGAVANRYDIVSELGEDSIKATVGEKYEEWLANGACGEPEPTFEEYFKGYLEEINSNYNDISGSTDFKFLDNDSLKVFAKDLKTYNNTTLQYIGIMPKNGNLKDYINNVDADKLNTIIDNLKDIELSSFEDGTITKLFGYIPMFQFEYELKLLEDLQSLGIKDVFNPGRADITGITSFKGAYINSASHKANIEFSNDGIKAAAATAVGGKGDAGCWFDYLYDVPVKEIDLTFDKPYLFLVRDKDTGEVWFIGTVYEPIEFKPYYEYGY